jgi:hypothetical protein
MNRLAGPTQDEQHYTRHRVTLGLEPEETSRSRSALAAFFQLTKRRLHFIVARVGTCF